MSPLPGGEALHAFLQALFEGIVIIDFDGTIVEVNRRAGEMLGADPVALTGSRVSDIVNGFDASVLQSIVHSLASQEHVVLEAHCVRCDKTSFSAEIAAHRFDFDGTPGICLAVRDVSSRQEAQERLQEAQEDLFETERAKTRMETIAKLAHEINNPLQVLMAMVEEDRNNKYAVPLNRIVTVMQEMRLSETVRSAGTVAGGGAKGLPAANIERCNRTALLVVDDEPALRHFFRSVISMKMTNLKVETVSNGRDAVELFKTLRPAVIIMDISMPVMSGDEAFLEISRLCRTNQWEMPAVIFCTGYTPPESVRRAIASEPLHCYLPKPVLSEALINSVKNRLEYFDLSYPA